MLRHSYASELGIERFCLKSLTQIHLHFKHNSHPVSEEAEKTNPHLPENRLKAISSMAYKRNRTQRISSGLGFCEGYPFSHCIDYFIY